ncbi:MAG: cytochrome [Leptolyngbyaceae cyanobacterium]
MTRILIGIIGPGATATAAETATASAMGAAIARQGWGLVTGGREVGVMAAASQGAHAAQGWVVGILPGETTQQMSSAVDIPILTGMGNGRNVIVVLSSRVVIACGLGAGTLSEIALALKLNRPLILMLGATELQATLQALTVGPVLIADTVETAIAQVRSQLAVG